MSSLSEPVALARLLLLLLTACVSLSAPGLAHAAELRTEVAARRVGVGQSFEVRVTAVQGEGEPNPENPQLTVQGKAQLRGPSIGTQRRVTMRNFSFNSENSVVATWTITPTREGKLVVGPATFRVGGQTLRGETVFVEVVQEAVAPPSRTPFGRPSIFGPDPNDIFGGDPFDPFSRQRAAQRALPEAPVEYQLSHAPDPISFLHIIIDKKHALLGEPIRLTVLAYGSQGNFREVSPNEPSLPDFLSYSVVESSHEEPAYLTTISGREYLVRKLREFVIVPLKTGELKIGAMAAILQGNGNSYPRRDSPLGMKITSPDLLVNVVEPPKDGRPDGYFPGDVGSYELKADVAPRQLQQGEYAEVIIQISGEGQTPSKVQLPESKSLVWEAPTMSGGPEIIDGLLQGTRVLKYPVQINEAGAIDLGQVSLPYYDQKKRRYATAVIELGEVTANPRTGSSGTNLPSGTSAATAPAQDLEGGLPLKARAAPHTYKPATTVAPPPWLWWLFAGIPVLVLAGGFALDQSRRILSKRKTTTRNQAPELLVEAKQASGAGQHARALKLLERALYESMDAATGRKNRGFLREHLAGELRRSGLSADLSERCQTSLIQLEQLRYQGAHAGDASMQSECEGLIAGLSREQKSLAKDRARAARREV